MSREITQTVLPLWRKPAECWSRGPTRYPRELRTGLGLSLGRAVQASTERTPSPQGRRARVEWVTYNLVGMAGGQVPWRGVIPSFPVGG